jgi:hypothetical protein
MQTRIVLGQLTKKTLKTKKLERKTEERARAHEGVRLRLRQDPRCKSLADSLYDSQLRDLKIFLRLRWRTGSTTPSPPSSALAEVLPLPSPLLPLLTPYFFIIAYSANNEKIQEIQKNKMTFQLFNLKLTF